MKKIILSVLIFCTVCLLQAQNPSRIEISEISATVSNPDVTVKWISVKDKNWNSREPTFTIPGEKGNEIIAKGWIAVTDNDILFKIIVNDDEQFNNEIDEDIWKGDAVQLGIDARGDGSGSMPATTSGMFGRDDAAFSFAISKNGPIGWLNFTKDKSQVKLGAETTTINRDEKKKTTTYELKLPWSMFEIVPGLYPSFGVSVQVNDMNKDAKEQKRYFWGKGADGLPRPGLFKKIAYGVPDKKEVIASDQLNNKLWPSSPPASIIFACATTKKLKIVAAFDDKSATLAIPDNGSIHRYEVKAYYGEKTRNYSMFNASLINDENTSLSAISSDVVIADQVIHEFFNKLDSLIDVNTNPLFLRHLRSVKAITQYELSRLTCYISSDPRLANQTLERIQNLIKGFDLNAGKYETYLEGKRSLIFAYLSKRDGTLQFFQFMPPGNWDVNEEYPLFVELHGAGDSNPLSFISSELGMNESSQLMGYTSTLSYPQQMRTGYHIYPYGRGNSRYVDIGEIDVWEAIKDIESQFKIDVNHRYLYGFSMGGGGTWSVAVHSPDYWAAIAIYSGAYNKSIRKELAVNLANTPVWISCGDLDGLFESLPIFRDELIAYGNKPQVRIIPGMRHNYRMDIQKEGYEWMTQYTRKRPDKFTFIADNDTRTGVWGISMERDIKVTGLPEFTCTLEFNTIRIESTGASKIIVNPDKDGLNLEGEIKVIWNGTEVYKGECIPVEISSNGVQPYKPKEKSYR